MMWSSVFIALNTAQKEHHISISLTKSSLVELNVSFFDVPMQASIRLSREHSSRLSEAKGGIFSRLSRAKGGNKCLIKTY
jgi:hypothetical protein